MHFSGYIGYSLLILITVGWLLGVRIRLSAGLPVILGSLFFVFVAVILPVSGRPLIHSWWLIPAGFAFTFLVTFVVASGFQLSVDFLDFWVAHMCQ